MQSISLIRHAEPALMGVMLGQLDPPLSAAGRVQAQEKLSDMNVAVVYSSPLLRAVETAQFIEAPNRLVLPLLREIDYGEWSGKTWDEIETRWSDLAAQKLSNWLGVTPPRGESWASVSARAARVLNVVRTGPMPAAIVGHQGVNAALAELAAGHDPTHFKQNYAEAIRIELA